MSTTATLLQTAAGVQVFPLVRGVFSFAAVAGLLVFFKPLLVGIARAMLLVVSPRLTKEQRQARRHMRDAQMLQRMINASHGPSHAAELRALAARA
ncbi:hypothetical protein [Massilia polaris]|uniref:hypothetical protein n=1 Tax=Massilia polaris TaxID=2728846 RepID=UPI001980A2EC|nr:hypothetical protein [Massilia polaris]